MIRPSNWLAVLAFLLLLSSGRAALAGRVVYFEILLDNKIVLDVQLLDQGEARQVDELAKKRTVDPTRRVREQVDAAARQEADKGKADKESNKSPKPADKPEKPGVKTVAILLFEGVELLDFAGPAEVFIVAERGKAFQVITVAETAKPLKTMGGISVTPDYAFENAPAADIVVVPGGNMRAVGKPGREWLKKASGKAEITMSVCYGALLLADVGLLNGLEATTHHWALDDLKQSAPSCKVVSGKRYVDSGKIITTAGVTAGIDGALRIVERLSGKEAAKWAAEEWMEHRRDAGK